MKKRKRWLHLGLHPLRPELREGHVLRYGTHPEREV